MNLLVFESSAPTASWAWLEDGRAVAGGPVTGRASSALASAVAGFFSTGRRRPDRILVGVGPGSFSGIRASIALAQGMAQGWGCGVEPLRSSHAVAHALRDAASLAVLADAKRGQYFLTLYAHGEMTHASHLISKNALTLRAIAFERMVSCGPLDGVAESMEPRALDLAAAWLAGGSEPGLPLEPIYLHEQVVPQGTAGNYSPASSSS
jgi:tRNA threonylcarbamoyl adenosine modification protein YeaZ